MYWLARIKPIQIESNANFTPAHGVINEIFAIHLGLNHLDLDPHHLPDGYLIHLLYALHRGHTDCPGLAREMYLLEKKRESWQCEDKVKNIFNLAPIAQA